MNHCLKCVIADGAIVSPIIYDVHFAVSQPRHANITAKKRFFNMPRELSKPTIRFYSLPPRNVDYSIAIFKPVFLFGIGEKAT